MKLCFRIVLTDRLEHADAPHALGLLRASGERPCRCRASEQSDELAPPHVEHRGTRRVLKAGGVFTPGSSKDLCRRG
jgi:hypothetical protein